MVLNSVLVCWFLLWPSAGGQSGLQSSLVRGTVRDASGGVLPGVTAVLIDVRTLTAIRTAVTGSDGAFTLSSIPPGQYRLRLTLSGFEPYDQLVRIDRTPPRALDVTLSLSHVAEQVLVRGTPVDVTTAPSGHVDQTLIETLPSESVSSALSSLLTLTSPGVA